MRLGYIDALRGVAIMGVMVVNTGSFGYNEYPPFMEAFIIQGERGVQLFFVLSAFTLFLSYYYRLTKGETVNKDFFLRRFFRIAPLYYMGILYYLWQDGFGPRFWLGDEPYVTSWNILSNFLFVHGGYPSWITSVVPGGWSITVEMMFYVLVPILVIRIKNLNQAVHFTLGTLIFAQLLKVIAYEFPLIENIILWKSYLNLYLPAQLPVFGCGIIAYFAVVKKEKVLSKFNMAALVLLFLAALIWPKVIPPNVAFGFVFLLLLFTLSQYNFKIIVNAPMQFLGKISYSLYLVHFAVIYWLNYWNGIDLIEPATEYFAIANFVLRFIVVLMISVPISYITFQIIEQPMQRFGKWIIKRK